MHGYGFKFDDVFLWPVHAPAAAGALRFLFYLTLALFSLYMYMCQDIT
jgi:hypothetical protein